MKKYLKLAAQVVVTILSALVPLLSLGSGVSAEQWINVAIIGVGACVVFTAPNVPGAVYTKAILSALLAGLTVVVSVLSGGISTGEWIQVAVAVLGALGVLGVKNIDPRTGANLSYTTNTSTARDPETGRFVSTRAADAAAKSADLGRVLGKPEPDGKDTP